MKKTLPYNSNQKRNVIDQMAWMSDEEIIRQLDEKRLNFSILLTNIAYDNNLGNIVRSANAFGAKEILVYGRKKIDRRACVGAEFYMHFRYVEFVEDLEEVLGKYDKVVAIENTPNAKNLANYKWETNQNTLICFGHEQTGLPQNIVDKADDVVAIAQRGSVRSLNVAVSAGIVMWAYGLEAL
jgi:tRNA G18 (ribose-2'-O)-methylase SpoU